MTKTTWLKDATIYHIFIDRFAGQMHTEDSLKPVFLGGTIRGIIDKLPYIADLGANVVWLSPFYQGDAFHGYQTTDLYTVDKHFGTEEDIKELLDKAHGMGLKVICDLVPNHLSWKHPFFLDAAHNKNSQYKDWFIFDRWPKKYRTFMGVRTLPKLNLDHRPAMDHMLGAARKWLALGFDGFRLDHIIGLSNQNTRDLIEPLRQEFPDRIFIGEAWFTGCKLRQVKTIRVPGRWRLWLLWKFKISTNNMLYRNYIGLLDGILDFEAAELLERYANARTEWGRNRAKAKLLAREKTYGRRLLRAAFLDNHDMDRFLFRAKNSVERLQMAAELQFSLKQPVIIYYGTEVGMTQTRAAKSRKEYGDIYCRQPMEWDPARQKDYLLAFYKTLTRTRKTSLGGQKTNGIN
jgi:glycosidase